MLLWLEGFQGGANPATLKRIYTNGAGTSNTFGDQYGRTVFDSGDLTLRTPVLVASVQNTFICGFGFQVTSGALDSSPSASPGIAIRNSAGEQLRLEAVDASDTKPGGNYYKWRVMRGATELARTVERFDGSNTVTRNIYFQFKPVIRTGTNGSFELKYRSLKGTLQTATWSAANTGINTANQASDGADRFVLNWTTGGVDKVSINDVYICDNTGSKNNDYLGRVYIDVIKPNGNGSTVNWVLAGGAGTLTIALSELQNTSNVTEDDRRITSDTVGDIMLATMTDLSSVFGTTAIVGVQTRAYGKMETVGSRDAQFFYRKTTGSPAQIGTSVLDLDTTTIVGEADTLENDPNTGTTWTVADINGLQVGVKLTA